MKRAAWPVVAWVVALARLWRVWWCAACIVVMVGTFTDRPAVRDAGTLTLAVLLIVLAWRGPAWWRADHG